MVGRVSIPAVYSSPLPRFIRPSRTPVLTPYLVGVAGFEPATFVPNEERFQATLDSENGALYGTRTRLAR